MQRRDFFAAAGASLLGAGTSVAALGQDATAAPQPDPGSYADVVARARELATIPFEPANTELTGPFADLGYDSYRAIRPRTIPLGSGNSGFAIDLLPPGFIFKEPVGISLVTNGNTQDLPFTLDLFDFDPAIFGNLDLSGFRAPEGLTFSGFRLRHTINRVDHMDEFAVFQGASYFRLIPRNMIYGLSGRCLALNTGDAKGEEFPTYRHFWIQQPAPGARSITVRALIDSESCTGAFEFDLSPGETTTMQTRCTLFPREVLEQVGIAPLTSMYIFGPQWRPGVDDFRSAVHDSEGLQMVTGRSERLWRPLTNPRVVQISAFQDASPKGFGLVQRRRDFSHYEDDEARYELRPTGWIEPVEDWGQGVVVLVEIPTEYEFNDNIVAFWRPLQPLGPDQEGHQFAYRLHWCETPPDRAPLARIHATRTGRSIQDENRRVMVVDFATRERWAELPQVRASTSHGEIIGLTSRELLGEGVTRASFEFSPGEEEVIELRLALVGPNGPVSETWTYRWTPA
jgi:periplasmic glucans biosynthesis protein